MKASPSKLLPDTLLYVAVRRKALEVIGSRIAQARDAKGWTQPDLAGALYAIGELRKPNFTTVSRWERGVTEVGVYTLERIAEILDKPLDFFTAGLGAKSASPEDPSHEFDHPAVLADLVRTLAILQTTVDLQFELLIQVARQAGVPGVEELARKMREQR